VAFAAMQPFFRENLLFNTALKKLFDTSQKFLLYLTLYVNYFALDNIAVWFRHIIPSIILQTDKNTPL
jgi:hypothetical protein